MRTEVLECSFLSKIAVPITRYELALYPNGEFTTYFSKGMAFFYEHALARLLALLNNNVDLKFVLQGLIPYVRHH